METAQSAAASGLRTPLRLRALVRGAVQGVGFRPFVFRLAQDLHLSGFVANAPAGVIIEAEGNRHQLQTFLLRIETEKPPLSRIEDVETHWMAPRGGPGFTIGLSDETGEMSSVVLPDIGICAECLEEIHEVTGRRYRYPFTNCTNCGPRYSIITRMPYDRPNTSMASFQMCPECRAEYENPADRRFHAQPIACPQCGPQLALWDASGEVLDLRDDALLQSCEHIRAGAVVAMKGIGGFLLLVDARNEEAVAALRRRKLRGEKPFALLWPDLDSLRRECAVTDQEALLLCSPEAPILLLQRHSGASQIAANVAADVDTLGVMLPYAPLHHLLMEELRFPVVATSGNLCDEPICTDESEALRRLHGIADFFLVHDRPIQRAVDDSVARVVGGREILLRRARGFAPLPILCDEAEPGVLALGGHLKNTVALTGRKHIVVSQHIGDLETPQALHALARTCSGLQELLDSRPELVAADLHPDYVSSRHARTFEKPICLVQHHYAHVLSVMAEHGLAGPVLGVCWDGTGYGIDGTVWGGEFLLATREDFTRVAHLRPFRLPGGDRCMKEPPRCAVGVLHEAFDEKMPEALDLAPLALLGAETVQTLVRMIEHRLNAPLTTSAGRFFDAVAALLDVSQRNSYEGQAAMRLERLARQIGAAPAPWPFDVGESAACLQIDWRPAVRHLVERLAAGEDQVNLAAAFHETLLEMICRVVAAVDMRDVVLSGGCFQNVLLLQQTTVRLEQAGRRVFWNRQVPPNDGGIALGQALYALHLRLRQQRKTAPCV
ncbi:MAG: carbamoyltransferase HypF [Candidatus Hydrogenedentes bacterium]|nr:carbamoyltransferase HypF [Candidatus Hydrogenedentota bacterium]